MADQIIDCVVDSLGTDYLDVDDFMSAVEEKVHVLRPVRST